MCEEENRGAWLPAVLTTILLGWSGPPALSPI
jgi:hypothetical protein